MARIITHDDFDGIISATLCSYAYGINDVIFTAPMSIINSRISISEEDIVCDLPYPLTCRLWFDHHEGNLEDLKVRNKKIEDIEGCFALKKSCARVVFDYLLNKVKFPSFFAEMIKEADIIDSFDYKSIEDWQRETPGKIINDSLKANKVSFRDKLGLMRGLVSALKKAPISVISNNPEVLKFYNLYKEQEKEMLKIIKDSVYFIEEDKEKEIIVIDLTKHNRQPRIVKNLAFLLYPDAKAVVEIQNRYFKHQKTNDLTFSMSLSISINQTPHAKDIGYIMRKLNLGDGHKGAAAGRLECSTKQQMLDSKEQILQQIFQIWSSQN